MDRLTLTEVKDMPLVLSRIVPVRREGNKVYMRTLRYGEEDSGKVVHLQAGDEPIIEAGDWTIDSREVDAQSEPGFRGYAPVANTVYVWCQIVREQVSFYIFSSLWPGGWTRHMRFGLRPFKNAKGQRRQPLFKAESATSTP